MWILVTDRSAYYHWMPLLNALTRVDDGEPQGEAPTWGTQQRPLVRWRYVPGGLELWEPDLEWWQAWAAELALQGHDVLLRKEKFTKDPKTGKWRLTNE
jgi:hypothetical protein